MTKHSVSKAYPSTNIEGKTAYVNISAEVECEDTQEAKDAAQASLEQWMDGLMTSPVANENTEPKAA